MRDVHARRTASAKHLPALDGIRGLAIVGVVFHNTTTIVLVHSAWWMHLLSLGWIGVQLFFALSGFLITAGLLETQGAPGYFGNFYAKRALRILPLYYTVLLVLLVILPRVATLAPPFSHTHQAPLWLFTANWTRSLPYGFGHFWSLSVEEQFYLLWPLVVYHLPPRRLLPVCLWVALGALLLRCVMAACGADTETIYTNTACRMDALALGGAAACVLRIPALRESVCTQARAVGGLALLVFLAGIPLTHFYERDGLPGKTFGYTLLALSAATFTMWAATLHGRASNSVGSLLAWPPLRSCGKYSYAMYVFHMPLHQLLGEPWLTARFGTQLSPQIVFAYGCTVLLVTYLLALVSYEVLEKPFMRLKRFF